MPANRIGLLGGTFDPVHNGHIAIAKAFLGSGEIDKLWLLLTPFPPHKKGKEFVSYEMRHKMLKTAFSGINNVSINTIEQQLPKPNYTIGTIRHLKANYPEFSFLFCMGEDSLAEFNTWKEYKELLNECELLVAKRPGSEHSNVDPDILEKAHFVEHIPVNISSTSIRSKLKTGKRVYSEIPEKVLDIIQKERLYS